MFFLKKRLKGKETSSKSSKSTIDGTIRKEDVKKEEAVKTPPEEEYEIVEKEILPEKMICPDCGGITLAGLDFCDKCGGELGNYENY